MNVERDGSVPIYQSGSSSLNFGQFHSNPQSVYEVNQANGPDSKTKIDRFKKLSIHFGDEAD